jgi:3-phosphoshikimate 1-carboxyvinyltransferase
MTGPGGRDEAQIPRSAPIDATVRVPSSKSLTNRALAAAGLARGKSILVNPLQADDTLLMAAALQDLGIPVEKDEGRWRVTGSGGRVPASGASLFLGNAGTAMRFLTPIVATGRGRFLLDGTGRMRERPMGDLLAALSSLGVRAEATRGDGRPPIEVDADGLPGGEVTLRSAVSSQFLSGLLLAAPCATGPLSIRLEGPLVSRPYVCLTVDVMERFGISFQETGPERYSLREGAAYASAEYEIEGDASSACWWFAAAAVTGGRARVLGIPGGSKQGDLRFLELLREMGCRVSREETGGDAVIEVQGGSLRGIDAHLKDMPDTAPALCAVALFASSPTRIHGAEHLRAKESDRIAGLAAGLGALGGRTAEHRDGLTIRPGPLRSATLDPLDDHRLAMAFAVAGLGIGGVVVTNPACVTKSYPGFFEELARIVRAG